MKLWHNTNNEPRLPEKVQSGQTVELWIGTSPIKPGQRIKVEWKVARQNGSTESGTVPAFWQYNEFAIGNSYWLATIGPFQQGDRVEYAVLGTSGGESLLPQTFTFPVEGRQQ